MDLLQYFFINVVCHCSSGPKKYATNLLICCLKLVGETVIWESGDGIVVKKRPDGIQLKCLHMYANNVILKMR